MLHCHTTRGPRTPLHTHCAHTCTLPHVGLGIQHSIGCRIVGLSSGPKQRSNRGEENLHAHGVHSKCVCKLVQSNNLGSKDLLHRLSGLIAEHRVRKNTTSMENALDTKAAKHVTIFCTRDITMQNLHLSTTSVARQALDVTSAAKQQHAVNSMLCQVFSCQESKSTCAPRNNPGSRQSMPWLRRNRVARNHDGGLHHPLVHIRTPASTIVNLSQVQARWVNLVVHIM